MKPLVGLGLGGPSFTARDRASSAAHLGEPVWGPAGLLRDLEMRLGLHPTAESPSTRVPLFARRIESLADPTAFYAASFRADAIGTSKALLAWRDALVEAGWNGLPIPGGGARLDALAAIEAHDAETLPMGNADRLARAERELALTKTTFYERFSLVEDRAVWPARWQAIFSLLEAAGTAVVAEEAQLPGATPDTDLGRLQRLLRENTIASPEQASAIRGDGSLLFLRGETPTELGELVAAFIRAKVRATDVLIIRSLDAAPLEFALQRQGIPLQGNDTASTWRPATQILPLTLELAFEPRDPYRVLELLTLPVGPFRGILGAKLARAVSEQPGTGGQQWVQRKEEAATFLREKQIELLRGEGKTEEEAASLAEEHVRKRLDRVTEWLEAPGFGQEGAPRTHLLEIARRICRWLQPQIADDAKEPETYRAAYSQARALEDALSNHRVDPLTRDDLRHLFDTVARAAHGHDLFPEQAGRPPHVDHPSALLAPAPNVVFWDFITGTERRPNRVPWNAAEQRALGDAKVRFVDPARLLAVEAECWRRSVLAATERVVFVVARTQKGVATAPHPLWDEITARLGIADNSAAIARLTHEVGSALRARGDALVPIEVRPSLLLPEPHGAWSVPPDLLISDKRHGTSATSLETFVSCPLSWVLANRARIREGTIAKVADGPLLNGKLSHRLVEELFEAKAFDLDESTFLARVDETLDALIRSEAATLLLAGAAFERSQLREQIRRGMRELRRYLEKARFRIAAVEQPLELESSMGPLRGRLDVRLVDESGKEAVLDLKWGAATYRDLIEEGRAVQLAVYSRALQAEAKEASPPPTAYYAISDATVITADPRMRAERTLKGSSTDETWARLERTHAAVQRALTKGHVPVANTRRARPLLEGLGVPESERGAYYDAGPKAACKYCSFGGLCGRSWESLA